MIIWSGESIIWGYDAGGARLDIPVSRETIPDAAVWRHDGEEPL